MNDKEISAIESAFDEAIKRIWNECLNRLSGGIPADEVTGAFMRGLMYSRQMRDISLNCEKRLS